MFLGRYGVTGQWQVLVLIKHEMEDLMLTHQHCELAKCVQFSAKVSLGKRNPDFQHSIYSTLYHDWNYQDYVVSVGSKIGYFAGIFVPRDRVHISGLSLQCFNICWCVD